MGSKFIVPLRLLELNITPALPSTDWHKLYYKNGYLKTLKLSEKDVVLDRPLDGFVAGPCLPIVSTDTVLEAFQKLQCQITAIPPIPIVPETFLDLTDTPLDYTTFSGYAVTVNATEDGLEFTPFPIIPPPPPAPTSYGLFNQLENSIPVAGNSNNGGSLINTFNSVGSLSVPPNTFVKGDGFKLDAAGHLSITGPPPTLIINFLFNGTPELTIPITSIPNVSNLHWNMEANFTIRKIGVSGLVQGAVKFYFEENANDKINGHSVTELKPLNTTIINSLDITATWSSTDAGDSIYSEIVTLYKIF